MGTAGSRWGRLGRLLKWGLAGLVPVLILAAAGAWFRWQAPLPVTTGTLLVQGAAEAITIVRDDFGVPHVTSGSESDAAFATGFLHGQDRLFQMDLMRRSTAGRLSELFGPMAVSADRQARRRGVYLGVAESIARTPGARDFLQAYADGVNAAVAAAWALPVEYLLLRASFSPWSAEDSILVIRAMQESLSHSSRELVRFAAAEKVGIRAAAWLLDGRLKDDVVILEDVVPAGAVDADVAARLTATLLDRQAADLGLALDMPDLPAAEISAVARPLVQEEMTALWSDTVYGSNSWVVAGARTAGGAPLLANDTHLALSMPAPFYMVDLNWPQVHVAGATVPGFPGVIIGRTGKMAWGVTILTADVADYVVETVHPEDPGRYLVLDDAAGAGRPFQEREELIQVRGGEAVTEMVRSTIHGPVVDEEWRPGRVLVRATWPAGRVGALTALRGFALAENGTAFRAAAAEHDRPAENLVYAHVDGTIGYVAAGNLVRRAGYSGLLPVAGRVHGQLFDGWDDPLDRPWSENPGRGFLVTANNRVMRGPRAHGWNGVWIRADRAARARALLTSRRDHDAASFRVMQGDTFSRRAALILEPLAELLRQGAWEADPGVQNAVEAWDILAAWDHRYDEGPAPGLYALFHENLLVSLFADELGDSLNRAADAGLMKLLAPQNFEDGAPMGLVHDWWDDTRTSDRVETVNSQVNAALAAAWEDMESRVPGGPATWDWPDMHRVHFVHPLGRLPLLARWFNGPDLPVGGAGGVLMAAAFRASRSFDVFAMPAMRMVADMGEGGGLRMVIPPGQSGIPASSHFVDQAQLWQELGDLEIVMPARPAVSTLILQPAP
ncbi:MAG: penicillin acylase family protein [Acidobacteria bacterium]|nr:MAG: penicillin acylase family protein [Acidobacteriota bacterium]